MDWESVRFKLFRLILPLAIVAATFAAVYSAANWYLVEKTGFLPLDEDIVRFWLPTVLAIVLTGALIAPGIRGLELSERRNVPFFYQLVAMLVIGVPAVLAQYYVQAASGSLTHVRDASLIASAPATKYYQADSICIDKRRAFAKTAFWTLGRSNQTLVFNAYLVAPLCGEASGIWIGEHFDQSIDNRLAPAEKEQKFRAFAKRVDKDYPTEDVGKIRYLERTGVNFARRNYEKALAAHGVSRATILVPHLEPFAQRTGEYLPWAFRSFGIGMAVWLVLVVIPSPDYEKRAETDAERRGRRKAEAEGSILQILVPRPSNYGLPLLIDINLGVYCAMAISGLGVASFQVDDLMAWGADYGPALHGLGLLRLITSQFVHSGLMHILQNMYGLIFAGLFLSPVTRNLGLIAAYVLCGLVAAIASVAVHPATVAVGASGAIMGLWGIALVLALFNDPRMQGGRVGVFVNAAIFAGLTIVFGAIEPGVDNAAHIGGLVCGLVLGAVITLFRPEAEGAEELEPVFPDDGMGTSF